MKSFLATSIIASMALAESLPCNPVALYRKRAINPTNGFIDRFDTTDMNQAHATHLVDRQIATICSNEANGTVPLYRAFSHGSGLHMSSIDPNEAALQGFVFEKIGFVYTQPQQGQTGFFKVTRTKIKGINYLSSNMRNEFKGNGVEEDFFYSMPLNEAKQFGLYPKNCNPVALYLHRAHEVTYEFGDKYSKATYWSRSENYTFLDRYATTDRNEDEKTHTSVRQIATICSSPAPGTVALYRGYNSNLKLHISTIDASEKAFKGFTKDRLTGYVYTEIPNNRTDFFQVFRLNIKKSEYMTTELINEAPHESSLPLFYSMPKNEARDIDNYPKRFRL